MSLFLDTSGNSTLAIGICARCSRKMPLGELRPDPNAPGLLVCLEDMDQFDPWRLPARISERVSVDNARPDVSLNVPTTATWRASTIYAAQADITPAPPNGFIYQCLVAGTSGSVQPTWPIILGQSVHDGSVTWFCLDRQISP